MVTFTNFYSSITFTAGKCHYDVVITYLDIGHFSTCVSLKVQFHILVVLSVWKATHENTACLFNLLDCDHFPFKRSTHNQPPQRIVVCTQNHQKMLHSNTTAESVTKKPKTKNRIWQDFRWEGKSKSPSFFHSPAEMSMSVSKKM